MCFKIAAAIGSAVLFTSLATGEPVLYGGNGGHPNFDGTPLSIHNGWLVTVDQGTGAVNPVGHPNGVARLSGIAFAGSDLLYGSTLGGGGFPNNPPPPNPSRLIQINPDTGALVSDIGAITVGAGGPAISISDLAIQPGTGTLYGIESTEAAGGLDAPFGNLYTISRTTGIATFVGTTGLENASLAFAPNGSLYVAAALINPDDPFGPFIGVQIATVNPATGAVVRSVPVSTFYTALTFDAATGLLIGGTGSGDSLVSGDIFSIDPVTGSQVSHISTTGLDFIGDVDFRPVPEPATVALGMVGVGAILGYRKLRRKIV